MFQKIVATYCPKPCVSEVVFGENLIEKASPVISSLGKKIVCIYDRALQRPKLEIQATLFLPVSANEQCKERKVKEEIENELIAHHLTADTVIVAVGGGSVLDLAGFVAATFCRGLPLCFFPTTLLAMVDAAIGGKNGVNAQGLKNYIGTLYHPHVVFVDFSYLQTLTQEELQNGLVEMFKIAQIYSREKMQEFDTSLLQPTQSPLFQKAVYESIQMKIAIVQESLKDSSVRDLLNFGHTIGHAIESLQNFQIPHGTAVCFGMLAESYASFLLGHFAKAEFEEMQHMLVRIKPALVLKKRYHIKKWFEVLAFDKKTKEDKVHMVLLSKRGVPLVRKSCEVPQEVLANAILWLEKNF